MKFMMFMWFRRSSTRTPNSSDPMSRRVKNCQLGDEEGPFYWHLDDVVVGENGSVVMAGGGENSPAVVKIDPSGQLEWTEEVLDDDDVA